MASGLRLRTANGRSGANPSIVITPASPISRSGTPRIQAPPSEISVSVAFGCFRPRQVTAMGRLVLKRGQRRRLASSVEVRTTLTRTERSDDRLADTLAIALRTSVAPPSTELASRLTLPILAETTFAAAADAATERLISAVAAC